MVQLSTCCYCISLRTGTLIIGLLHLIGTAIGMGGIAKKIFDADEVPFQVLWSLLLIFCCLEFMFGTLLIIAAKKGRASYVSHWIVYKIMVLVLCSLVFAIYVYVTISKRWEEDRSTVFVVFVTFFAASIYVLLVVHSFFISLKKLSKVIDENDLTSASQTDPNLFAY